MKKITLLTIIVILLSLTLTACDPPSTSQITNAIIFGVLYAAVRLRVNNIWPLIVLHMLFDVVAAISGFFGPAAIHTISDIPVLMWALLWVTSLATAFYLIRKPVTATVDGKPVG